MGLTVSPLTIVSGCPGAGKTTLAAGLAAAASRGAHIVSDTFYTFPARLIDPADPASHEQNTTILKAVGRAAAAFLDDGYQVVLDGVVGPWFLPVLAREIGIQHGLEYVVLSVSLDLALRRVRERDGPGASTRVEHMHAAFSELGNYAHHELDTSRLSAPQVLEEFVVRSARGDFELQRDSAVVS